MRLISIFLFAILSLGNAFHAKSQPNFTLNYPDTLMKNRLRTAAGIGLGSYAAGISFLGFIWYKDQERVPFHLYDDSKGYLQMDKAGHAYGAYHESYLMYYALRWAGVEKKKALLYGGSAGFIFQAPIEIFDGLYEDWGFSWYDIAANATGSILFITQEAFWEEQRIIMKFSYAPSGYPKYHSILGETELERFFLDYNGHTYWLSANINSFMSTQKVPSWLNIALGYSANGMIKEFENPEFYMQEPFPKLNRYRQWFFSLDVDWTRVKTKKPWVASLLKYVNMIKVPFPAIELNGQGEVKFRPVYF